VGVDRTRQLKNGVPLKTNFSELHRQVVFGQSNGKIIWQPRIGCWYDDKMFSGEGLPAPYTGMNLYEVYRALGCSARLYEFNSCFRRIEHPAVAVSERPINATDFETTIRTPVGKQTIITRQTASSPHRITLKREVVTREEMQVAIWREENMDWAWDPAQFDKLQTELGDLGAPTIYLPRMNVQCLYLEKMGVESGIFALLDWPDLVEAFFRALEENHNRLIDWVNPSPIEIINFGENVHSATLSPDLFLKYHLPTCQRRCERLHAAGKFVYSHWDGDTRPLLKFAKETGLDGIEAITPLPQGDVTLDEIKAGLGDDLFLIDGLPAIYFDQTFSEQELLDCTRRLIELFAPKLVLGISDEISSTGDLERARRVDEMVNEYNAQFD
jgi:hypothetical protein